MNKLIATGLIAVALGAGACARDKDRDDGMPANGHQSPPASPMPDPASPPPAAKTADYDRALNSGAPRGEAGELPGRRLTELDRVAQDDVDDDLKQAETRTSYDGTEGVTITGIVGADGGTNFASTGRDAGSRTPSYAQEEDDEP